MIIDILNSGTDFIRDTVTGIRETRSIENMPLLGLFGGNVQQSTPVSRSVGEELDSWCGNAYGLDENSETERLLSVITLSSSTPEIVRKSVLNDLSFLSDIVEVKCEVTIPTVNRLRIDIELIDKKTSESSRYLYIWGMEVGGLEPNSDLAGFDYTLDFTL